MASANRGGSPSPTSPRRIAAAEKQALALGMRKAGYTLTQIAEKLGYASDSGVRKALHTALEKTVKQPAEDLRLLITARNDEMLTVVYPRAQAGELEAVDRVVKIGHQTALVNGLISTKVGVGQDPDANPVGLNVEAKVEVSGTAELLAHFDPEELRQFCDLRDRLVERLRAAAAGGSDGQVAAAG